MPKFRIGAGELVGRIQTFDGDEIQVCEPGTPWQRANQTLPTPIELRQLKAGPHVVHTYDPVFGHHIGMTWSVGS
jgi:hypothetical protein